MDFVVGEKHSTQKIKGYVTGICGECYRPVGIPKKNLEKSGKWFKVTCPACGNTFHLFASLNSCYEGE